MWTTLYIYIYIYICVCVGVCVSGSGVSSVQRALGNVSVDEWVNIPEVGDSRNKKKRNAHIRPDRYTPVPDSILAQGIGGGGHTSLDPRQQVGGCSCECCYIEFICAFCV